MLGFLLKKEKKKKKKKKKCQDNVNTKNQLVILNSKAESGGKIMDLKPKNKATLENQNGLLVWLEA